MLVQTYYFFAYNVAVLRGYPSLFHKINGISIVYTGISSVSYGQVNNLPTCYTNQLTVAPFSKL